MVVVVAVEVVVVVVVVVVVTVARVVVVCEGGKSSAAPNTSRNYSHVSHFGQHLYSNMQVVMYSSAPQRLFRPRGGQGRREREGERGRVARDQISFPGRIIVCLTSTLTRNTCRVSPCITCHYVTHSSGPRT